MIPPAIRAQVERSFGPIQAAAAVQGGCINFAARLELRSGPAFLKWNLRAPDRMFAAEAGGLRELRKAATELRVPEVLGVWNEGLLLEWLQPSPRGSDLDARLGAGLAALHRAEAPGGHRDNWIGVLPQCNTPAANWPEFWIVRRLEPQLRRAHEAGRMPGRRSDWDALFAHIPVLLAPAEQEGLSLLHGDLWSGNAVVTPTGPALVDPAAYRGHREVDLAMSELFGGFGAGLLRAYRESWSLLPGYAETRRAIYQLYPLLVHVNLFGGSYVEQTAAVLRSACF